MEYDPKDNEVIHLLKKLKDSNGAYPPEMLALRRQGYLKQVAEVSAGGGLAAGLKNIAKGGKGTASLSSTAGTIVEALLVVAIVAEAGAVTYFYRDKVADYVSWVVGSPKVEEVASPPVLPSPFMEIQATPSPILTATMTGVLPSGTPSSTPSSILATPTALPDVSDGANIPSGSTGAPSGSTGGPSNNTADTSGSTGSQGQSASTPAPKGNNGNHYGQTPKPERTKEVGNSGSNNQSNSTQESNKNKNKP